MEFDGPRFAEILRKPTEDLSFEIKEWLALDNKAHRAKLAQAMIALANHGGGAVLIGYSERADGSFVPATPAPADLNGFSSDVINEISRGYLSPAIHCEVKHIKHPDLDCTFPIIIIPGGHHVPIMAKRGGPQGQSSLQVGRTYIRRVGPTSEEPQSPEEWRGLLNRCIRFGRDALADQIRLIVSGQSFETAAPSVDAKLDDWIKESEDRWQALLKLLPQEHPARFPLGYYRFAYQIRGDFQKPSLTELKEALRASKVRHSGWPHWPILDRDPIRPAPVDDTIECFLARDDHSETTTPDVLDYWRVSTSGRAYSIRGLNEDSHSDLVIPGTGLDVTTPTWRLADGITHAVNLAEQLGANDSTIDFDLLWFGLSGRRLVSVGNPRRSLHSRRVTHQNSYQRRISVLTSAALQQLPEIVDKALRPLYETFDFFQLPADLTTKEIAEWRKYQF